MPQDMINDIRIMSRSELSFSSKLYRCAVGTNDFAVHKREGDQRTPMGRFALRECWYRADRISKPATGLALRVIEPDDAWCDDPHHTDYNRPVKLPFDGSHEQLWRDDFIYDIFIPIGYNDGPIQRGVGSAIFFHLAKPDYTPTQGCVSVIMPDMLEILKKIGPESRIIIEPIVKMAKLYRVD